MTKKYVIEFTKKEHDILCFAMIAYQQDVNLEGATLENKQVWNKVFHKVFTAKFDAIEEEDNVTS